LLKRPIIKTDYAIAHSYESPNDGYAAPARTQNANNVGKWAVGITRVERSLERRRDVIHMLSRRKTRMNIDEATLGLVVRTRRSPLISDVRANLGNSGIFVKSRSIESRRDRYLSAGSCFNVVKAVRGFLR